jgi:hypothetical protein
MRHAALPVGKNPAAVFPASVRGNQRPVRAARERSGPGLVARSTRSLDTILSMTRSPTLGSLARCARDTGRIRSQIPPAWRYEVRRYCNRASRIPRCPWASGRSAALASSLVCVSGERVTDPLARVPGHSVTAM